MSATATERERERIDDRRRAVQEALLQVRRLLRTAAGGVVASTLTVAGAATIGGTLVVGGTVTASGFVGSLTGNASTATALQTARTLWGQSFDGTGNVSGSLTGVTTLAASGAIGASQFNATDTGATLVTMTRTGSGANVAIQTTNTDGSLFFGMNSSEQFAVAATSNLAASPWITVSSSGITLPNPVSATSGLSVTGGALAVNAAFAHFIGRNANGATNVLALNNLDSTAATLHQGALLWNFSTTAPATVNAASITVAKLQEWTSTASTQDSVMTLRVAIDGALSTGLTLSSSSGSHAATFAGSLTAGNGTFSSSTSTTVQITNTTSGSEVILATRTTDNAAFGGSWIGRRSRTTGGAVSADDVLAGIYGQGHDGTSFYNTNVGAIRILAAETHTTSDRGTKIDFATTTIGSLTRTVRGTITDAGVFNWLGNVLVGTATAATGAPRLDVIGTNGLVGFADTTTDAATKSFRLGVRHYTNSEEMAAVIYADSGNGTTRVNIGGGTALFNAATLVQVYTAGDNVTTTGTLRASWNSVGTFAQAGDVDIGAVAQASRLSVSSSDTNVTNWMNEAATVDARAWSWRIDASGNLELRSVLDNNSTSTHVYTVTRAGLFSFATGDGIIRTTNSSVLGISGSTATNSGGNLRLFGSAHATQASDLEFRQGSTVVGAYDHSAVQWIWDVPTTITSTTGPQLSVRYNGSGVHATLDVSSTGVATLTASGASAAWVIANGLTVSPASANVVLSPTGSGVVTINPASTGTLDNVTIGGTTARAGTFTTVAATTVTASGSLFAYTTLRIWRGLGNNSNSIGIGASALDATTSGASNIAIGGSALAFLTTGSNNVVLGVGTFVRGTTHAENVVIGNLALSGGSIGQILRSVVIGYGAAVGSTASGDDNVFIGYASGGSATTLATSVLIGSGVASAHTTGSNVIVIGYQASASGTTVSNEITLGNGAITAFRIPGLSWAVTTTTCVINQSLQTAAPTGGAGAWKLGVANAVSPTAPNRTVTIDIDGTLYYLHAKTTND